MNTLVAMFYELECSYYESTNRTNHATLEDAIYRLGVDDDYSNGVITEYEITHEGYCVPKAVQHFDVLTLDFNEAAGFLKYNQNYIDYRDYIDYDDVKVKPKECTYYSVGDKLVEVWRRVGR